MSNNIYGKPYVIDVMARIAKERKRLERNISSPDYEKNKILWGWMEEWLKKTDEEHFEYEYGKDLYYIGLIVDKYCVVCGKKDRFFLAMDFSFCDEYDCGIQICQECLEEMKKIFMNGVSSKNDK